MTQVSEDAAFVRYPPPALSQRARGFQPLLPVKVAGGGCEGIIKKFAKTRHLRGIIKKLAIWREDSSSGWPPLIVTTPNTLRPQNREGEFSVNLLTFSFTKSQSIKFSRSPEDQYGSLGKYFSPNVYKDYFPRSMKTLKRKLYQHFM